jgi:3-hydroxyacyl-[acyl-carrier-protein] dehydratase
MQKTDAPGPLLEAAQQENEEVIRVTPEMAQEILLHRRFALKIESANVYPAEKKIVVKRELLNDDPHFDGHFDGRPIFPGIFMIEIAAQAGVVLAKTLRPEIKEDAILTEIKQFSFKRPATPGGTLNIEVTQISANLSQWKTLHFSFSALITNERGKLIASGFLEGATMRQTPLLIPAP